MITKKLSNPKSPSNKEPGKKSFPIVALGSSAGGLEAISVLLKFLPPDTGMAFIYVQHLSPDQKSLTTALLSKQTKMRVQEIGQMELIRVNNVYVIPNDKGIQVTNGHIKLISRERKTQSNLSADTLFISLAQTHTDEVIGIVLSGNANDGTLGLKAIKNEGGITFAQDHSAKNGSMPQSAIDAGVVDFVMSPKEIALNLARLGKHFKKHGSLHFTGEQNDELTNADLKSILTLVYDHTGIDFSLYKVSTIRRRILRRILLSNVKGVKKYISLLSKNKNEAETLQSDLIINFTSFFRDNETHEYLKKKLFPKLLKNRTDKNPLRIWTVACSTGEEAYSIAMILQEILGKVPARGQIQIFATDLSASAIRKARNGFFTKEELKEVSKPRVARFFTETDQGFRVNKSVRDMCVFAAHNVISEPPFSRLDLICCCNMLIYLDLEAQKKVLSIFHYSLKDTGYLVLGKSETAGASGFLFSPHHKKLKIYTSKKHSSKPELGALRTAVRPRHADLNLKQPVKKYAPVNPGELERRFDSVLLDRFFPACVVINNNHEIVLFRGKTSPYLENPTNGKASLNIIKMARPEIAFDLRSLLTKGATSARKMRSEIIELKNGSERSGLIIEVIPFSGPSDEPFFLILFNESVVPDIVDQKNLSQRDQAKMRLVEKQLLTLKSDMIQMIKDHEGSTQELQTANEEIVSSNEELQSLNEELETSREEIESTNEELNATIQELLAQNQLLAESYRYAEDIIATLHEPMLVLDHELNIRSANAAFYKLFKLKIDGVEGHSFYKIDNRRWAIQKLRLLLGSILRNNSSFQGFPVTLSLSKSKEINLLLNAKKIIQQGHKKSLILLAMAEVNTGNETRKK
jgi:two-component system, chemotaxis family, CheB/CheR fusion protein